MNAWDRQEISTVDIFVLRPDESTLRALSDKCMVYEEAVMLFA